MPHGCRLDVPSRASIVSALRDARGASRSRRAGAAAGVGGQRAGFQSSTVADSRPEGRFCSRRCQGRGRVQGPVALRTGCLQLTSPSRSWVGRGRFNVLIASSKCFFSSPTAASVSLSRMSSEM